LQLLSIKIDFGSLVFYGLVQFGDPKLQPLYFSAGIDLVEHLPVLGFTENTKLYTADKDSGIHNMELSLVCIEEFDTTVYSPGYKRQRVCAVDNEAIKHSFAVELPYH
jgi:hypothetical protein